MEVTFKLKAFLHPRMKPRSFRVNYEETNTFVFDATDSSQNAEVTIQTNANTVNFGFLGRGKKAGLTGTFNIYVDGVAKFPDPAALRVAGDHWFEYSTDITI